MKKIKLAVVGTDRSGIAHLKTCSLLNNDIAIAGVCDTDPQRGREIANEFQTVFFPDFRDLVPKIDAVSICTPVSSRYEIAHFFIDNGIHTFIQSPTAHTVQEADNLVQIARFKNTLIQIGCPERFNSAFSAVKNMTPDPLFIECRRLNTFSAPSFNQGVVLDLMVHDIALIQKLLSSALRSIHGSGTSLLTEKEDMAMASLNFENGAACHLTSSHISTQTLHEMQIFTQNACISLDLINQEAFVCQKENDHLVRHNIPFEKNDPLVDELKHFIECIRNNKKPLMSGEDARDALQTALAIQQVLWAEHIDKS